MLSHCNMFMCMILLTFIHGTVTAISMLAYTSSYGHNMGNKSITHINFYTHTHTYSLSTCPERNFQQHHYQIQAATSLVDRRTISHFLQY